MPEFVNQMSTMLQTGEEEMPEPKEVNESCDTLEEYNS